MTQRHLTLATPLGPLRVTAEAGALVAVRFAPQDQQTDTADDPLLNAASAQFSGYFARQLRHFDLPLAPQGTPFQQRVWAELVQIPYGHTITYAQLALQLGDANLVRAVGAANGQNPLAIVVPCHRVIGAGGKLVGYAGGLERKAGLLALEGSLLV